MISLNKPIINSTTFNKLSDFTNFYLQKNSAVPAEGLQLLGKDLSIPRLNPTDGTSSLGASPVLSSSPSSFTIPKLTNSPIVDAASHLTNATSKTELTPHEISLRKIMDLKKIHITEKPKVLENIQSPLIEIDLSTALRTDTKIPITTNALLDTATEPFVPMYIDCDLPATLNKYQLMPNVTQDCEIDISHLLNVKLPTARVISKFGKTLCSRYRCKDLPYIMHCFEPKHSIKQFLFGQPSPDDIVLKQLQKWK